MNNEMNAVIYARYSSHNQTERSIDGQLQDCYDYAKRCGYTVVGEYIDRALTGTNDNRNSFQKMIADAHKCQFQFIIVYKLDRFARNRYDSAIYKNKIKKYGIKVVSAMEQISDSPEGIILESVLEGMAEYYSANLSQNIKRGMRVAVQNKTHTGGIPPYGYKVVDRTIQIDEKTAPIAKSIFEQYAKGISKKDIIAQLNENGYRSQVGKPFTTNVLTNILKNPKYIGICKYNDEEIEGIYPPIIDKDVFKKVQDEIKRHKRAPAANKADVKYLLQGKLFCGYCGAAMVGDSGTGRTKLRYYYYSCGTHKKRPADCKKKREKKDFIEWYVVEQSLAYILAPGRIEYIADKLIKIYDNDFDTKNIRSLEKRIATVDDEINKLIDLALNTTNKTMITKIEERANLLELQKEDLSIDLAKLKIANKIQLKKDDIIMYLKTICNGDLFDEQFRLRIIDTFINSIYLFDDKIVMYYNIKDSKQVSYIEMLGNIEDFDSNIGSLGGESGSDFNHLPPPEER